MYYYTYQRKFFFIKTAGRRVIFARMLNVLKDVYEKVFETTKAVSALFVTSWYSTLPQLFVLDSKQLDVMQHSRPCFEHMSG